MATLFFVCGTGACGGRGGATATDAAADRSNSGGGRDGTSDGDVADAALNRDSGGADVAGDGGADAADACPVRRCGVDVACGTADFGCGSPLVCPPCAQTLKIVALDGANHLVANRARGLLLVSIGSAGGSYANQVVTVDPVLATVTGTLSIPDGPDQLAVSDDGSRLWIGVASDAALRWVDLTVTPPVVSAPVSLPAASDGTPTRVGGMGAVPGAPHSVAVSLIYDAFSTVSGAGTFVFDDGTVRAAHTPAVAIAYPSQIIGGPPGVLFEAFEHSAPAALTTLHVTSTAVTEVQHDPSFAIGGGVYSDGMIYGVANVALDVHDPDHPVVVGPLEAPGVYTYTLTNMQPLVSRPGRVFMVGYDIFGYLDLTLRFADVAAHRAVASSLLSGTGQGDVLDLVSVPPSRMAMLHRTATVDPPTRLFIITHDLLATP